MLLYCIEVIIPVAIGEQIVTTADNVKEAKPVKQGCTRQCICPPNGEQPERRKLAHELYNQLPIV